jgi:hypothetical protein
MAREDNGGPKSSPVGTWELMSFTSHLEDGSSIEPWPNAVGRIAYDASGNVTSLLISGRRNEADGRSSPSGHTRSILPKGSSPMTCPLP